MHLRQVVAAEETAHLIGAAAGLREGGVDAHLFEALGGQQVRAILIQQAIGIHLDMVHHRTGVVVVDDVRLLDGRVVAAAVAIDDGTALYLKIGLVQLREMEAHITLGGLQLCNRILMILVLLVIDGVYHLAWIRAWCLLIIIVTVTAGKELSDIYFSG